VSYLIDTCVISELSKNAPAAGVIDWLQGQAEDDLHLSVITVAELRRGISRLPQGKKRTGLEVFFTRIRERFAERILPITDQVAITWGEVFANERPLNWPDSMIAATAWAHQLTVVTRNRGDMERVCVLDLWEG
jgi:toxin FitB